MHEVCHEERHGEICLTTRNGCTAFYGAFGSAPFRVVKQISLRPVTRIPILVPESLLDFCKGALFVVPPVSSFRQILAPRTPQMKKQPVHSQAPAFHIRLQRAPCSCGRGSCRHRRWSCGSRHSDTSCWACWRCSPSPSSVSCGCGGRADAGGAWRTGRAV
jgi:hypothetical protein